MAVYTDVDDGALSAFIAKYDIGTLESCKGIAEGVENSNFLLTTTTGSYILTLYEKRVCPDDLPFFLALMTHLAGKGMACPIPLKGRDGTLLHDLCGRPAAIVTFLRGMWPKRITVDHCAQLGAVLAHMHVAGADFALRRPNALGVRAWRPLFETARHGADGVHEGLQSLIERELCTLERLWPADLPHGVIHADAFPDNVFFLNNRFSGLIDFYFACTDVLCYDVAVCLNAWCFDAENRFNVARARALLTQYRKNRPLGEAELAALPVLCRGAAMRFLLTRLYDWLNTPTGAFVDPKDPLEYIHKLRFHATVTDPCTYGIDT